MYYCTEEARIKDKTVPNFLGCAARGLASQQLLSSQSLLAAQLYRIKKKDGRPAPADLERVLVF